MKMNKNGVICFCKMDTSVVNVPIGRECPILIKKFNKKLMLYILVAFVNE